MKNHSIAKILLNSVFCAGLLASSPAFAGFEFTAPISTSPSNAGLGALTPMEGDNQTSPIDMNQSQPQIYNSPQIRWVDPGSASSAEDTVVIESSEEKAKQQPSPPSGIMSMAPQPLEPLDPLESMPMTAPPSSSLPQMPQAQMSSQNQQFEMAVCFGENLPLVSALRQVIPPEYTYVLNKNVNAGQTVSWNGGQQWPLVLNDMLRPAGLSASLDGSIVKIRKGQSASMNNDQNSPAPIALPASKSETSNDEMFMAEFQEQQEHSLNTLPPLPQREIPAMPTPIVNSSNALQVETTEIAEDERESVVPNKIVTGQWTAPQGSSLKTVLESWSELQGVDLYWSSKFDYILAGDVNINGTYEDAVKILLDGFSQAQPKPTGRLHPNLPNGPAVLVIESQKAMG